MTRGGATQQRVVSTTGPKSTPEPQHTIKKAQSQPAASTGAKANTGSGGDAQQINTTTTTSTNKISWLRGYVGAHSNTDPPDAKFLGVAAIVLGAGFYAWFVEPPVQKEDS